MEAAKREYERALAVRSKLEGQPIAVSRLFVEAYDKAMQQAVPDQYDRTGGR